MGMIADITGQLAAMRIMINDLNTRNFTDGRCLFSVTVIVNSLEHLKNLVDKLRKVDDVLEIERTGV